MSGKTNALTLATNVEVMTIVESTSMSKSAKIRLLYSQGNDKSTIANLLGIRYQHVRNVLLQPLKSQE